MEQIAAKLGFGCTCGSGFESPKLVETHISTVIIGRRLVLKFKKPVDFGFINHLHFPARWRSACNEITLNRRLSSDIYLGLLPISSSSQPELSENNIEQSIVSEFDPELPPKHCVDVAVVMNRIPDDCGLDALIDAGQVEIPKHIRSAASKIAEFHLTQMEHALVNSEHHSAAESASRDNFEAVRQHRQLICDASSDCAERVERYSENYLSQSSALFDARINARHVIDGHGDLRAEHICYPKGEPQIIDCLEFSTELRTVDLLSDIAFLTMDFDSRGRTDLSAAFIQRYAEVVDENFVPELFFFYETYRAMVRAKVELLNAESADEADERSAAIARAEDYLALAGKYSLGLHRPYILLIGGLMGAGKSTLADYLSKLTHARVLRSDILRKSIYGSDDNDKSLSFGEDKYSAEATTHTYLALAQCAQGELIHSRSVIVDASFTAADHRRAFVELGRQANLPVLMLWCTLDREKALERLNQRQAQGTDVSDGRAELYDAQREKAQTPNDDDDSLPVLQVDTNCSVSKSADKALAFLCASAQTT